MYSESASRELRSPPQAAPQALRGSYAPRPAVGSPALTREKGWASPSPFPHLAAAPLFPAQPAALLRRQPAFLRFMTS